MSLRRDLRHGLRIGRAEFKRSVRQQLASRRQLIGLGVAVLFFGGNLLFALPTAYALGRAASSITTSPFFAAAATLVPVALFLLAVFRTLERIGKSDRADLLLATVHPRAVVVGLITAEIGRLTAWFALPLAAFVTTFALGLGAPSVPLLAGLVVLPIACWAAVWGYAAGLAILRGLQRLPTVRRTLKTGGVIVMLVVLVASQFVGQYVAEYEVSLAALLDGLSIPPLAEYIALAFLGTPLAEPVSPAALLVLAGLVATTPLGLVVATRQASTLWFTDAPTRDATKSATTSSGGFQAPRPFAWRKAGRIAWGVLVRGVRNPGELGHLVMAAFFIGPLGTTVVQASSGSLGPLVAGLSVGLATYLAGATFGLNPLGDDRPHLPVLLLTPTDPPTLVRGRVLAGLAIGCPVAVLGSLASILLGTAPGYAVAFAAVGLGMCLAAALFAVGLGAAYPIYEERQFWGTETIVPSTLVLMGYTFIVGIGTAIGLITTWYLITGHVALTPVLGIGLSIYLLLTIGPSYGLYRYALRRYRQYRLG
jgi:ABC-2 type transport system permease protein